MVVLMTDVFGSIEADPVESDPVLGPLFGRPLVTTEVKVVSQVRGSRKAVWPEMRWLWKNSQLDSLRKCHKVRYDVNVDVFVSPDGSVSFAGFCRCHSVWACPLCAPVIRAGRASDMASGLKRLLLSGGGCLFSTYTLPHDQGDALGAVFSAVHDSWTAIRHDPSVRAIRRELGLEFSRSTEVTYGSNGWHPHLHVGEVAPRPLSRSEVLDYRRECFRVWCQSVQKHGFRRPSERRGLTVVRADAGMSDYLNKTEGLASELFQMDQKRGKTEAPFSILSRAVRGDAGAARVWGEYERVTKGRRAVGQSRGFKVLCPVSERSDMDIMEGGERSYLGTLRPDMCKLLVNHPHGFEGFMEMVGPGTAEAWGAAVRWLTGTAPWWLSLGGIARYRDECAAAEASREALSRRSVPNVAMF